MKAIRQVVARDQTDQTMQYARQAEREPGRKLYCSVVPTVKHLLTKHDDDVSFPPMDVYFHGRGG